MTNPIEGRLASLNTQGNTNELLSVYTVPSNRKAIVNINIMSSLNNAPLTNIDLVHIVNGDVSGTVSNKDYIRKDSSLNTIPIEKNNLRMKAGDTIGVLTTVNAIIVQINGVEQDDI